MKKQNAFPWKFQKTWKRPSFRCQKYVDQKYLEPHSLLEPSKFIIKKDGLSIRFLTIIIGNLEKLKKAKIKK